jgi:hypothetical protein
MRDTTWDPDSLAGAGVPRPNVLAIGFVPGSLVARLTLRDAATFIGVTAAVERGAVRILDPQSGSAIQATFAASVGDGGDDLEEGSGDSAGGDDDHEDLSKTKAAKLGTAARMTIILVVVLVTCLCGGLLVSCATGDTEQIMVKNADDGGGLGSSTGSPGGFNPTYIVTSSHSPRSPNNSYPETLRGGGGRGGAARGGYAAAASASGSRGGTGESDTYNHARSPSLSFPSLSPTPARNAKMLGHYTPPGRHREDLSSFAARNSDAKPVPRPAFMVNQLLGTMWDEEVQSGDGLGFHFATDHLVPDPINAR